MSWKRWSVGTGAIVLALGAVFAERSRLPRAEEIAASKPPLVAPTPAETELETSLRQARDYLSLGQIDSAIAQLDRALELDGENQEARTLRGDAFYRKGELDQAMNDYAKLRSEKGALLFAQAEQIRANALAQQGMNLDYARTLSNKAAAARQAGRLDEAIEIYTTLMALDLPLPDVSAVCQNRGNAYWSKGEDEKAMRDYEQAIRFNPRNAGAYVNRGVVLSKRGENEGAIKDYNEALRLEPKLADAFYNRALSFEEEGETERALQDLTAAIALKSDFALAYLNRGKLQLEEGDFEKAEKDFAFVEKIDAKLPQLSALRKRLRQLRRQTMEPARPRAGG